MSEWTVLNSQARLIETETGWYAYLDNDDIVPVDEWYDDDGEPCEPKGARYCVAGTDEFGWVTIELHDKNQEYLN